MEKLSETFALISLAKQMSTKYGRFNGKKITSTAENSFWVKLPKEKNQKTEKNQKNWTFGQNFALLPKLNKQHYKTSVSNSF